MNRIKNQMETAKKSTFKTPHLSKYKLKIKFKHFENMKVIQKINTVLIFFSLMIVFQNQSLAQDWRPFPANQKTWFEFSDANQSLVALYYAANVIQQGNETRYYVDANNTANETGLDALDFCKQFYQDRAEDFVSIWEPIIEKDDLYYYKGQLVFDTNLNVGDGIFIQSSNYQGFDEVYLECVEQRTQDVFGQNDEVKEFSLKAYANGQPVASAFDDYDYILSKSNGLLKFLPFTELLNQPKTTASITGFEDAQGNLRGGKGDQFKPPYEAGDVIYYFHEFGVGSFAKTTKNFRDSITAVVKYADSLIYTFDRVEFIRTEYKPNPVTYDTVFTYNNNNTLIFDTPINDILYYSIYGYRDRTLFEVTPVESSINEGAYQITTDIQNTTLPGCFDNWSLGIYSSSYHSDFGKINSSYFSDDQSYDKWKLNLYQKNGTIIYAPFGQLDAVYNQFDPAVQLNGTAEGPGVSGGVFYPYEVPANLLNVPFEIVFKIGIWEFKQTISVNGSADALINADPIFTEYAWLSGLVNPTSCDGQQIEVYQNGPYKFLYISDATSASLYYINGTFYCEDTPTLSCLDLYALSTPISSWVCANNTTVLGCTDANAINYIASATVDDGSCQYENINATLFVTYPWLSTYVNLATCQGESITVFDAGSYNFILVRDGNESNLYFENGTFYCNETPTYSCVDAYGLTNVAQTWYCGNNTSVSGCTDTNATNYNPTATLDDGSCQFSANPNCNINDWTALKALYENTNGDNWVNSTGWAEVKGNEPTTSCNLDLLFGVETDGSGRVTELILLQNQLNGTIPTELSELNNLRLLNLTGNLLSGSIPEELGYLNNLYSLDLSVNQLSESIPNSLGNLSNLTKLTLFINQLNGTIPAELSNLSNLTSLDLHANQLSGSIPTELSNLANLTELNLNINQLSGSIPAELSNLSNLTFLGLALNQLSGNIPTELGNLSNLETLALTDNQLSGNIPFQLGNLSNLEGLVLTDNQLNGSIPAELGNLSNLESLYIANNQLSGGIPAELGNLSSLETLNLSNNQLSGSMPAELGNLSNLTILSIRDNNLNGCYPQNIRSLCSQFTGRFFNGNTSISGGNNFDTNWANFCATDNGVCLENNSNNSEIFTVYPWLSVFVNESNCTGESIKVYDAGSYNFILIQNGNEGKLYFENGVFYCNETPSYSCVDAYNLSNIAQTWFCGNNPTPISGCTDANAINYNTSATVDDGSCEYSTPDCSRYTGTFFYADCGGINYYFIRLADGRVFDPYFAEGIGITPREGQQIRFDYEIKTDVTTPCIISENPITITCFEEIAGTIFEDYPWLSTLVNESNCSDESITVYDAGSYNFILVQKGNQGKLYYQNGTFYCDETPTYSCVTAYNLSNIVNNWNCGGLQNQKQTKNFVDNFNKEISFSIYPNPTTSKVFIDLPDDANYQVSLRDISGKVIKQVDTNMDERIIEMNVGDLPKGMYIIELKNKQVSSVKKLIIK